MSLFPADSAANSSGGLCTAVTSTGNNCTGNLVLESPAPGDGPAGTGWDNGGGAMPHCDFGRTGDSPASDWPKGESSGAVASEGRGADGSEVDPCLEPEGFVFELDGAVPDDKFSCRICLEACIQPAAQ